MLKINILVQLCIFVCIIQNCTNSQNDDDNPVTGSDKWTASVKVIVNNANSGNPIPGASVVGKFFIDDPLTKSTNNYGEATFSQWSTDDHLRFELNSVSSSGYRAKYGYPLKWIEIEPNDPNRTIEMTLQPE